MARGLILVVALGALCPSGWALVIASGDGTGNTTVPASDHFAAAFAHVSGAQQLCNSVYLGQGVVLSAAHASVKDATFAGRRYRLEHAPQLNIAGADLMLKRIVGAPWPDLPVLPLSAQTPAVGTPVRMVAGGYVRRPQTLQWGIARRDDGWTWTRDAAGPDAVAYGFQTVAPPDPVVPRWGTNVVERAGIQRDGGLYFITTFSHPARGGTPHEAQASGWDSGGSVFVFNHAAGRWELAGLMVSTGSVAPNAPNPIQFAVLDASITLIADVSPHRAQIVRFMVTPKTHSTAAAPLTGPDVACTLLEDALVTPAGRVEAHFTQAQGLVLESAYQLISHDMIEPYLQTQQPAWTRFDFPPAGRTTQLWRLDASAGRFQGPVRLSFHYDPSLVDPELSPRSLTLFRFDGRSWVELRGTIDAAAGAVTVTVEELGVFALGVAGVARVNP